eukprot:67471_1
MATLLSQYYERNSSIISTKDAKTKNSKRCIILFIIGTIMSFILIIYCIIGYYSYAIDLNQNIISLSDTYNIHGHNNKNNILQWLYPTATLQSKLLDFTKHMEINTEEMKYFLERSLSIYPGNEGPILDILFNKLILNTSNCIDIGILGGIIEEKFDHHLQFWLNEMFTHTACKHKVRSINDLNRQHTMYIESIIGDTFADIFLSSNKYDIVIVIAETVIHNRERYISNLNHKLIPLELYFRHLLEIPNHPVIINLETTVFPSVSHFATTSIVRYYQIVSLSLYDSFRLSFVGTDMWNGKRKLISTIVSYYLFIEYNKVLEYLHSHNNDMIS